MVCIYGLYLLFVSMVCIYGLYLWFASMVCIYGLYLWFVSMGNYMTFKLESLDYVINDLVHSVLILLHT